MSDTFTFVAPVMPRRRMDPFAMKLAAFGLALAVAISGFAMFVNREERAADARRATFEAQQAAQDAARARQLDAEAEAGLARQHAATSTVPAAVARLLDTQARDAAARALALARGALGRTGDLSGVSVAQLSQWDRALLFVDGPSTAPSIVSVAQSGNTWAAAAMGPSGTCYWVSLDAGGGARYDRGTVCTGQAALAAARAAW
jgi:hypothetical protein